MTVFLFMGLDGGGCAAAIGSRSSISGAGSLSSPAAHGAQRLDRCAWLCLLLCAAVEGAGPAGRLEISPRHPYYFRAGSRHVVLVGVSDRQLFTLWENDKGLSWQRYLDSIASHHLNYVRQDVCTWGRLNEPLKYPAQLSQPAWVFERTGPGVAVDRKAKFDLTRFDQSYFDRRLKPFLREAARRGIYVELTLFEGCKNRAFDESLYADENNINRLALRANEATSNAALGNPRLMAVQHAYIDKVLAETAAWGHVIYEVANETGGSRWVAHIIDYIRKNSAYRGALISAGEQSSSFDPCRGANHIVVKHRGGAGLYATDADVRAHRAALMRLRSGKPVSHNEYFLFANRSTDDLNFPRKMMWADFTGGGHSNFFDFTFWRGTGRTLDEGLPSRSPPREILMGGQYLVDFLAANNVAFWTMEPRDGLARVVDAKEGSVFTLANAGEEYVCYVLGDGPMTIALRLAKGIFTWRWYDPKSGRFCSVARHVTGGERSLFRSPVFEHDIVLHVVKAVPKYSGSQIR